MRNFHVPLPENLHAALKNESKLSKKPSTELARIAIQEWLELRKKQALSKAILEYAQKHAGGPMDLDEELEEDAMEFLSSEEGLQ